MRYGDRGQGETSWVSGLCRCLPAAQHPAFLNVALQRKPGDAEVRRKSDSKKIANAPGPTEKLIWQVPEGIF